VNLLASLRHSPTPVTMASSSGGSSLRQFASMSLGRAVPHLPVLFWRAGAGRYARRHAANDLCQRSAGECVAARGFSRPRLGPDPRDAKTFSFLELNDGSCLKNLQVIADAALPNYAEIQRLTTGASVSVRGQLVPSQGQGQKWEVKAAAVEIIGTADATYPLQKKGHTPEFLREIAHLRPRSNLFGCVFRVRSRLAFAVHQFFQERGSRMSTRRSSPAATAKAPVSCSASPPSI